MKSFKLKQTVQKHWKKSLVTGAGIMAIAGLGFSI